MSKFSQEFIQKSKNIFKNSGKMKGLEIWRIEVYKSQEHMILKKTNV